MPSVRFVREVRKCGLSIEITPPKCPSTCSKMSSAGRRREDLLDHSQDLSAVPCRGLCRADILEHGRKNCMRRKSQVLSHPDGRLILENFDFCAGILRSLKMNQKAAMEFGRLPFVEIFGIPVEVAGRFVQVEIALSQFRWDAHISFDKRVHTPIEQNLFI